MPTMMCSINNFYYYSRSLLEAQTLTCIMKTKPGNQRKLQHCEDVSILVSPKDSHKKNTAHRDCEGSANGQHRNTALFLGNTMK